MVGACICICHSHACKSSSFLGRGWVWGPTAPRRPNHTQPTPKKGFWSDLVREFYAGGQPEDFVPAWCSLAGHAAWCSAAGL